MRSPRCLGVDALMLGRVIMPPQSVFLHNLTIQTWLGGPRPGARCGQTCWQALGGHLFRPRSRTPDARTGAALLFHGSDWRTSCAMQAWLKKRRPSSDYSCLQCPAPFWEEAAAQHSADHVCDKGTELHPLKSRGLAHSRSQKSGLKRRSVRPRRRRRSCRSTRRRVRQI